MSGTNEVLGGGGLHHVAMRAKDFDASVRFYTEALGFKEAVRWGEADQRAVLLDTGDGSYLELFAGGDEGETPKGGVLHFAVRCEDVDGVTDRARRAGAVVTGEPKDVDIPSEPPLPVRIAFFKGPDGELIELFHVRKGE